MSRGYDIARRYSIRLEELFVVGIPSLSEIQESICENSWVRALTRFVTSFRTKGDITRENYNQTPSPILSSSECRGHREKELSCTGRGNTHRNSLTRYIFGHNFPVTQYSATEIVADIPLSTSQEAARSGDKLETPYPISTVPVSTSPLTKLSIKQNWLVVHSFLRASTPIHSIWIRHA